MSLWNFRLSKNNESKNNYATRTHYPSVSVLPELRLPQREFPLSGGDAVVVVVVVVVVYKQPVWFAL